MKAPYNYLFKSYMEDGEEILYIIHHHVILMLKPLGIIALFHLAAPAGLWYLFPKLSLAWLIWLTIGVTKFTLELFSWYFNAILITNLNLVDVEWNGVFDRTALRIEYNQIEGFAYTVNGFWNTVLNMGDITISKLSGNVVNIAGVHKPKKRSQLLTKVQDELVNRQLQKDHTNLKDILTNMLQSHIQEHGIRIDDKS